MGFFSSDPPRRKSTKAMINKVRKQLQREKEKQELKKLREDLRKAKSKNF